MDSSGPTTIETELIVSVGYARDIKDYLVKIRLNNVIVSKDIHCLYHELIFNNPKDHMLFQLRGGLKALYNHVRSLRVEAEELALQQMVEEIKLDIEREALDAAYVAAQYETLLKDT